MLVVEIVAVVMAGDWMPRTMEEGEAAILDDDGELFNDGVDGELNSSD